MNVTYLTLDSQNVLDDRLRQVNCGVVLGAIRLFFHLTEDMVEIQADVYERIKSEQEFERRIDL